MTEKRSDAFAQAEREENPRQGTYMRPSCMANGCPMLASLMTNSEQGVGMCAYHGFAKQSKSWPAITEILLTDSCKRLRHAIQLLRSELNYRQRQDQIDLHIAEIQNAGSIFGLSVDDLRLRTGMGWWEGRYCEMTEAPQAYLYRVEMKLIRTVIDRAINETNGTNIDYKQLGLKWCEIALNAIAGRGCELMGGV